MKKQLTNAQQLLLSQQSEFLVNFTATSVPNIQSERA